MTLVETPARIEPCQLDTFPPTLADLVSEVVLSRLIDEGLVASDTPKGPVSLRFDTKSAGTLFPRLFPAQA